MIYMTLETVLLVFELVFLLSFFFGMKTVTVTASVQSFLKTWPPSQTNPCCQGKVRETQRPVRLLDPNPDPLYEQVRDCHWGRVESVLLGRGRSLSQVGWARSCTQRHLWCPWSWLPFKLESKFLTHNPWKSILVSRKQRKVYVNIFILWLV